MKIIAFILLSFILIVPNVFAMPSEEDRQEALTLMYTMSSDQELHFRETSNYETSKPKWKDGFIYQSCAYSNFVGKGYITTVSRVIKGKVWVIERHFGDNAQVEDNISEYWTCKNCQGEQYAVFKEANEHELCNI